MESNERALKALEQSWDDKLQAASELEQKRQAVLDTLGLGKLEDGIDKTTPHLVNLNEDPNLNEQLLYFLKAGQTTVGAAQTCAIVLEGAGIVAQHVRIDVETSADAGAELVVTVTPLGTSNSFVNGEQLRGTLQLKHSDRVIFGARSVRRPRARACARRRPESRAKSRACARAICACVVERCPLAFRCLLWPRALRLRGARAARAACACMRTRARR
jgi:kinesin family protein 1